MNNKEESKSKLSGLWNKTVDLSKKAADGIQKGAKEIADKAKDELHEQRLKKYNPLFVKEYKSKGFVCAKVIKLISNDELHAIDVCDGAIGWRDRSGEIEILNLSFDFVKSSNISFFPSAQINEVYCVDPFDCGRYIQSDSIFSKAHEERLAELERIAYVLGAKMCTVELIEGQKSSTHDGASADIKIAKASAKIATNSVKSNSGKTISRFSGNNEPKRPELKWFQNDQNILALIDMRCSGDNSIKSRSLTLAGSTSASMSKSTAVAVDCIKKHKASASMEKKAIEEHNQVLIFEVEF